MKIDGPNSAGKTGQAKKAAKTSKSAGPGFSSALRGGSDSAADPAGEAGGVAGGAGLGSVDALLALQGVDATDAPNPDAKGRNRAAVRRGSDLLDRLDELRIGLLTGRFSRDRLVQMRDALSGRADAAADPTLQSVLEEIELRVEVELAKHDR